MTLYEEGKFKFDDPIAQHIPELADLKLYDGKDENGEVLLTAPTRQPLVIDFLRHTAGLMSGSAAEENPALMEIYREISPAEWTGRGNADSTAMLWMFKRSSSSGYPASCSPTICGRRFLIPCG